MKRRRSVRAQAPGPWWRNRDGSALVEGAVLLPVLMLLMFGVYEFSWLFYQQHVMADAVRDAARHLARSFDPCDPASPSWAADQAAAQAIAAGGAAVDGPPRIRGWTPRMIEISCTPIENPIGADGLRTYRGELAVFVVTVSSRIADPSLGFFGLLGLQPPIISISHSERVTGPG